MPYAELADVRIHYRVDGAEDAPVVVLSNSLGTNLRMWDPQVPALAARMRVIRYDTRGHGRSSAPPGPYSLDDLGRDVLGVLDTLGVTRASVAGASLGGATAQWLALRAPERVDRLALCGTSARFGTPEMWKERAAAVRADGMRPIAEASLGRWLTSAFADGDPVWPAKIRSMLLGTDPEGYAGCCAALGAFDNRAALAGITAPTLVVVGEDDPSTPRSHAEALHEAIRGARMFVVPGAAHLASIERADLVTPALLEHLTGPAV